jgi:hypothetical protein
MSFTERPSRRFFGLDLTDPYSSKPREVDVAIVHDTGRCEFTVLPAFSPANKASSWLAPITKGPASGDVLVIDGPLGLSNPGDAMRDCERRLGTPGKTPDDLPVARSKPFAGYIRGSVELAEALVANGWAPFMQGKSLTQATMLEAYPGGTWTLLAGEKMPHKRTGVPARTDRGQVRSPVPS